MPNLFAQFQKKPVQVSKPRKVKESVPRPSWFFLTDDEWLQYENGDVATKHELLTKLWSQQDLPF